MPFDVLRVRGGCRLPYEGSCPRRGLRGGGMSLSVSAPFTPSGSLRSPPPLKGEAKTPFDVLCERKSIASPYEGRCPAGAEGWLLEPERQRTVHPSGFAALTHLP